MFDRIQDGLWWDKAWSLVGGCTPVSPACDNCWAAAQTQMRANHPNDKVRGRAEGLTAGGHFNGNIRLNHEFMDKPLRTRKPTAWAVWNDLFHEDVPDEFIHRVFAVMSLCPHHTFMVLTKRAKRMAEYLNPEVERRTDVWEARDSIVYNGGWKGHLSPASLAYMDSLEDDGAEPRMFRSLVPGPPWPLPNVWLGVTAENQETADRRIPLLLQTPAAVRFVSVEPMLGPVDLTNIDAETAGHDEMYFVDALTGRHDDMGRLCNQLNKLDWVICGGESGPNARPMHPDWARSLRDQCQAANDVPFFFKQWGEWYPDIKGLYENADCKFFLDVPVHRIGKKAAGRLLDGREWNELPSHTGGCGMFEPLGG